MTPAWPRRLRLALSTLTVLRVGVPAAQPGDAGGAMAAAPAAGILLGALAGAAGLLAEAWTGRPLPAAVAAVAALAWLTRALHLDGLADTADGLGSAKPAEAALAIMKRSDIGPFGVVTLILMLAAQTACLAAAYGHGRGFIAVLAAAAAGRCAVPVACTPSVPPARPEGLGAWVAGSVRRRTAAAVCAVTALVAAGLCFIPGVATDFGQLLPGLSGAAPGTAPPTGSLLTATVLTPAVLAALSVPVALAAALLLLRRCVRRFGGITGDVLGALTETGTTAALLLFSLR